MFSDSKIHEHAVEIVKFSQNYNMTFKRTNNINSKIKIITKFTGGTVCILNYNHVVFESTSCNFKSTSCI